MLTVGLTGGVGSGKTTVSTYFMALGVPVIDADVIARELVMIGLPAYRAIIRAFGSGVLNQDGTLDRQKLRHLIFSDAAAKATLESILHPMVYDNIRQKIEELKFPYCILSIPLLIEVGDMSLIDRLLVIDVDPALQVSRVSQRDGEGREHVEAMIKSQVGRQARLACADDVLINDGDIDVLRVGVGQLHKKYSAMAM